MKHKIIKSACIYLIFAIILFFQSVQAMTWNTAASGYWSDGNCWIGGIAPPYTSSDTFYIHNFIEMQNSIFLNASSFMKIDSSAALCGHRNMTFPTGTSMLKYGILELDTLFIPGGQILCYAPGQVILTQYGVLTNGGSLTVSGPSMSVGPWFTCLSKSSGIEELDENNFEIFPNPSSRKLNISFPPETKLLRLISFNGQLIFYENVENKLSAIFDIQSQGIFFVEIVLDDRIYRKKVVNLK